MKRNILVIDDEEITLKLLAVMLKNKGFNVLVAQDPARGLELAAKEKPDLIILDVFMPMMDGWDVLSQLQTTEPTREIPVVMLTSADQIKDAEMAFDLGASGYLTKPINPTLFNKKITDVLSAPS